MPELTKDLTVSYKKNVLNIFLCN